MVDILLVCPTGPMVELWRDVVSSVTRFNRETLLKTPLSADGSKPVTHYCGRIKGSLALYNLLSTGDISVGVPAPGDILMYLDTMDIQGQKDIPRNTTLVLQAINLTAEGKTVKQKLEELNLSNIRG